MNELSLEGAGEEIEALSFFQFLPLVMPLLSGLMGSGGAAKVDHTPQLNQARAYADQTVAQKEADYAAGVGQIQAYGQSAMMQAAQIKSDRQKQLYWVLGGLAIGGLALSGFALTGKKR